MNNLDLLKESLCWVINGTQPSFDVKSSLTEDVLQQLYKISKWHDVAHLTGHFLIKNNYIDPNTEIAKLFKKEVNLAIFRYSQIEYELSDFCKEFDKSGIPFILLKGSVVRQYYPEPWMRTSCDIDVLVKREDHEKAMEYLKANLNYQFISRGSHDVSLKTQSGVHVELHYKLIEEENFPQMVEVLNSVWEHALLKEGCNCQYQLDDEMFYYYQIAHMAKHMVLGGAGARSIVDIYLINKVAQITAQSNELLQKGNIKKFALESEKLARIWFDGQEMDDVSLEHENYIISGGVYGTIENGVASMQNKKGGKFKYLIKRIFPPFSVLSERYPILKKHCYLTPIYYAVRWFEMIFSGRFNRAVTEVKALTKDDDKAQKTKRLLEDLGL